MRPSRLASVGFAAVVLVLTVSRSGHEPAAEAAPCQAPVYSLTGGVFTIEGDPGCQSLPEKFQVICSASSIAYHYEVGTPPPQVIDSTAPNSCPSANRVSVLGHGGDDVIDLSGVSPAAGFTGISAQNTLDGDYGADKLIGSPTADLLGGGPDGDLITGGSGSDQGLGGAGTDTLLMRDGVADSVDCGADFDSAQADQQSTDSVANCELTDFLPATVAMTTAPVTTKKKCKKKRRSAVAAKKKRCKRKR